MGFYCQDFLPHNFIFIDMQISKVTKSAESCLHREIWIYSCVIVSMINQHNFLHTHFFIYNIPRYIENGKYLCVFINSTRRRDSLIRKLNLFYGFLPHIRPIISPHNVSLFTLRCKYLAIIQSLYFSCANFLSAFDFRKCD